MVGLGRKQNPFFLEGYRLTRLAGSGTLIPPSELRMNKWSIIKVATRLKVVKGEKEPGWRVMTKSQLIQRLAELNPHLYQRDVERIVSAVFEEITAALERGERVELRGFGAFSVKYRDARSGRNPRTGETVQVNRKAVPFFKTGKLLRDLINEEAT